MGRDDRYTWNLSTPDPKRKDTILHSYIMGFNPKTDVLTGASFFSASAKSSSTPIFCKEPTQDSLSFQDPRTSISYRWLSNRPISSLDNERYDYQRNALFRSDPGKDIIVADWTCWDGHASTPNLCLTICDPHVDHALDIVSLTMLHDHHWIVIHDECKADSEGICTTQETARLTTLGLQSYWTDQARPSMEENAKKAKMQRRERWERAVIGMEGVSAVLQGVATALGA